jgi:hypothetical protein
MSPETQLRVFDPDEPPVARAPFWALFVESLQPRIPDQEIQRFDRCLLALACGAMLAANADLLDRLHRVPGAAHLVLLGDDGFEVDRWPIARPVTPMPPKHWPWLRLLFGRWR